MRLLALLLLALLSTGCTFVRPIALGGHLSHATQHVDGTHNRFGCNFIGGGARIKPHPRVQIDLTESYSFEGCGGPYRETFLGTIVVEF